MVTGKNEMDAARGRKTAIPKPVEDCLVKMLTQLIDNHHYMDTFNLPIVVKEICEKLGIKTTNWIGGRGLSSQARKRRIRCPWTRPKGPSISWLHTPTPPNPLPDFKA